MDESGVPVDNQPRIWQVTFADREHSATLTDCALDRNYLPQGLYVFTRPGKGIVAVFNLRDVVSVVDNDAFEFTDVPEAATV